LAVVEVEHLLTAVEGVHSDQKEEAVEPANTAAKTSSSQHSSRQVVLVVDRSHFDHSPAAGSRHNRNPAAVEVAGLAVAMVQRCPQEVRSYCNCRPAVAVAVVEIA